MHVHIISPHFTTTLWGCVSNPHFTDKDIKGPEQYAKWQTLNWNRVLSDFIIDAQAHCCSASPAGFSHTQQTCWESWLQALLFRCWEPANWALGHKTETPNSPGKWPLFDKFLLFHSTQGYFRTSPTSNTTDIFVLLFTTRYKGLLLPFCLTWWCFYFLTL